MSPENTKLETMRNSEEYWKNAGLLPEFVPFVLNVVQEITSEKIDSGEIPLMFAHSACGVAQWCCGNIYRPPEEQRTSFNRIVDREVCLNGEEFLDFLIKLRAPYSGKFNLTEKFQDRIFKLLEFEQELENCDRMLVNHVINEYLQFLQSSQHRKPIIGLDSFDIYNVMDKLKAMGFDTSGSDYILKYNEERLINILREKKRPDLIKIVNSGPKKPDDGD